MKGLDKSILKTLCDYYFLAAADLSLYPEGTPEHIRAEHQAANTSRTVFELFGAQAVGDMREEALKRYPKLGKTV